MNEKQLTRVAGQLERALGEGEITRLGVESGFTRRLRTVTPFRLAVSILGAMSSGKIETIADVMRSFHALTGCTVQYKPFHNQLAKDTFPVFMLALFERLLGSLALQTLAPIPRDALRCFNDIVLQDGSSFAIHAALQDVFPGRFTATNPAAVELHATMSLFQDQPLRVSIAPDSQAERDFLPTPTMLEGKLLLADRGYMDLQYCANVIGAGGSFIVRFTRQANPTILGGRVGSRRAGRRLVGRRLHDCLAEFEGKDVDLDVGWPGRPDSLCLRLVMIWNDTTREHMLLATNLDRECFDAKAIRALYRLRWQIELLFKEWKSYANLKPYCTRKAPIAEGLIWGALCAALLKRFLAHAAQAVANGVEVSTRTSAMALGYHLPRLFDALLHGKPVQPLLGDILKFLATSCRRAHPGRDRKSGRLQVGLRPVFLNARLATCVVKD